jgi:GNAT superfamily N-acetyltransferase
MLDVMEGDVIVDRVRSVWAAFVGFPRLETSSFVVAPGPPLCREGWIGLLTIEETLTVSAPDPGALARVRDAVERPSVSPFMTLEWARERFPGAAQVRGPAALLYPVHAVSTSVDLRVEVAPRTDLDALLAVATTDDAEESGLATITGAASVIRDHRGDVAAACGWQSWPHEVAHLCVLTHPSHRRTGLGRAVATDAIRRAAIEGLLPQWRAAPAASRQLAVSIGLVQIGVQLSLDLGRSDSEPAV